MTDNIPECAKRAALDIIKTLLPHVKCIPNCAGDEIPGIIARECRLAEVRAELQRAKSLLAMIRMGRTAAILPVTAEGAIDEALRLLDS